MVLDANAEALGEVVDRPFEAGVVEGHEAPALAADQVVMMGSAGVDGFEPGLARADGDPLGEAVLDQQLEHPVDAGSADRRSLGAKRVLDLDRAQGAGLAREQLDHPLPRPAALVTGPGQHRVDVFTPGGGFGVRHLRRQL